MSASASGSSEKSSKMGMPPGSPHSQGPAASRTVEAMETVRARTLRLFGCTEQTHTLVFTSGATAAARLVADHFPWQHGSSTSGNDTNDNSRSDSSRKADGFKEEKKRVPGNDTVQWNRLRNRSAFAHSLDCHTSCLGMRAVALGRGAEVACLPRPVTALPFSPRARVDSNTAAGADDANDDKIMDVDTDLSKSTADWLLSWPAHGGGPPDAPPGMVYDTYGPASSCTDGNKTSVVDGIVEEGNIDNDAAVPSTSPAASKAANLACATGAKATCPKGTATRWSLDSSLWWRLCKLHIAVACAAVLPVMANTIWIENYMENSSNFSFMSMFHSTSRDRNHKWLLLASLIFVVMFISFAMMSVVFDDSKTDEEGDLSSDSKPDSKRISESTSKVAKRPKRPKSKGFAPLGLGVCFPSLEPNSSESGSSSSSEDEDYERRKIDTCDSSSHRTDGTRDERQEKGVVQDGLESLPASAEQPADCLLCCELVLLCNL
jgi:hypothetical protein